MSIPSAVAMLACGNDGNYHRGTQRAEERRGEERLNRGGCRGRGGRAREKDENQQGGK